MRFSPYAKLAIPAVSVLIIPVGQRASLATFYPACVLRVPKWN